MSQAGVQCLVRPYLKAQAVRRGLAAADDIRLAGLFFSGAGVEANEVRGFRVPRADWGSCLMYPVEGGLSLITGDAVEFLIPVSSADAANPCDFLRVQYQGCDDLRSLLEFGTICIGLRRSGYLLHAWRAGSFECGHMASEGNEVSAGGDRNVRSIEGFFAVCGHQAVDSGLASNRLAWVSLDNQVHILSGRSLDSWHRRSKACVEAIAEAEVGQLRHLVPQHGSFLALGVSNGIGIRLAFGWSDFPTCRVREAQRAVRGRKRLTRACCGRGARGGH